MKQEISHPHNSSELSSPNNVIPQAGMSISESGVWFPAETPASGTQTPRSSASDGDDVVKAVRRRRSGLTACNDHGSKDTLWGDGAWRQERLAAIQAPKQHWQPKMTRKVEVAGHHTGRAARRPTKPGTKQAGGRPLSAATPKRGGRCVFTPRCQYEITVFLIKRDFLF